MAELKWPEVTVLSIVQDSHPDYLRVVCASCGECVEFTDPDPEAQREDAWLWLRQHVAWEVDPERERAIGRFAKEAIQGAKTQLWGEPVAALEAVGA